MNEQYQQDYLNLLQAIIDSLDDEKSPILRANSDFTDSGLVQKNLQLANDLRVQGDLDAANYLMNIATHLLTAKKGDKAVYLELQIQAYQANLLVYTQEKFPYHWAAIQSNLGNAYAERIWGDKADNLDITIACYENALLVFTRDSSSHNWAMTQNNLGNAYRERMRGDQADNLEIAIACYENSLLVFRPDGFPYKWAEIQNNLADSYGKRIRGDQADNLEIVIACYENALLVFKHDDFPYNWAMTQNNLGIAYRDRIMGDKAENLELAIACYENALLVYTQDTSPYNWAMTQTNLVAAYNDRIIGDEAENLELAIACGEKALLVHTRDTSPYKWAGIQNNLGTVYRKRILGNKAENLEFAIACYENALLIHTYDTSPYDWAMTQHNLGGVYYQKTQGNKADNLELAIRHIRSALEIYTPTNLPFDCFSTAKGLGDLAFKEGLWKTAIEGYEQAVAAVELSRSWTSSDNRRQEILAEAITIYQNLVQILINTGQFQKAIKYVESSRSRMMVDLMASNDLYSKGEIPLEVQKYLQQFESLQQQIDQEREYFRNQSNNKNQELVGTGNSHSRAAFDAETEKIKGLESEKQQIWQKIRSLDDVLAGQIQVDTLDFAAMQQLIDTPTTAILSFYTTDNDTHIFILRQNEEPRVYTCTGQGLNTLHNWIFNNWLLPYIQDKAQWLNQMGDFLQELAERLHLNDLIAQHLEGIKEIILIPHLYLHQIPFAALPIDSPQGEFLEDRFLIRYAPSCQILKFCNDRKPIETFHEKSLQYGIVENATDDLYFTSFECEKIDQIVVNSQRLQGREQAIVKNYRQLAQIVNVLHSSHHANSRLDNPLESKLSLGDGSITLGELVSPGWRLPQLSEVFLSCCETNLGLSKITDDVLTLSAGFLCAGARSVINTLWSVDDLATALFSIFYYEYRQSGENRAEAVRKAQVKLRNFSGEELRNKYQAELESMLNMKKQQAESERKTVRTQRKQQVTGTYAYEELDEKYQQVAKLVIAREQRDFVKTSAIAN